MTFSVIIPALNEEATIGSCIRSVRAADEHVEIIVVDGRSDDKTAELAVEEGATVIRADRGRGTQMNRGASVASGEFLIFLHADCTVFSDMFEILRVTFRNPAVQIGTGRLQFDMTHPLLRFYGLCARLESRFTTYGDQGIAVKKSFFESLGGFADWPLFEDVDLLQRARTKTNVHKFPTVVVTSARRFLQRGIIRQQLRNAFAWMLYLVGVSPHRIARMYKNQDRTSKIVTREHRTDHQRSEASKLCEQDAE